MSKTSKPKNEWYIATLIVQCIVEEESRSKITYDEQIRAVRATDIDDAYAKAIELGHQEEHTYKNVYGKTVVWEFVGLEDLEKLFDKTIHHGTEMRSRFFEHKQPAKLVKQKHELSIYVADQNKRRVESKIIDAGKSLDEAS